PNSVEELQINQDHLVRAPSSANSRPTRSSSIFLEPTSAPPPPAGAGVSVVSGGEANSHFGFVRTNKTQGAYLTLKPNWSEFFVAKAFLSQNRHLAFQCHQLALSKTCRWNRRCR